MQILDSVVLLISKLPPESLDTLRNLVNSLLKAKTPEEAQERLQVAAMAVAYKAGARATMDAALRAKSAVKKAVK